MSWSSSARLAALQPHSAFAVTNDYPKQHNALRTGESDGAAHVRMAVTADFARTIPLAELMHADRTQQMQRQMARSGRGDGAAGASATSTSPLGATLNRTQQQLQPPAAFASTLPPPPSFSQTAQLPVRVPAALGYSAALAQMHADRADRMVRQPRGWSQGEALARAARRDEEKEERIAVLKPDVHDAIVADSIDAQLRHAQMRAQSAPHRNGDGRGDAARRSAAAADRAAHNSAKQQQFWADVQEQKERLAKRLSERMSLRRARDDAAFASMLARLNDNKDLLADIEQYLAIGEQEGERRKERLYQQWCAQVYEPTQSAIAAGLAARPTADVEARRVRMFNDFLRASNRKKEGLHLDVLVEPGYFPLESRRHTLRVHTGKLRDPLKASLQSADDEWRLHKIFHPDAERIVHQTKSTLLPPPIWAKYKIESTPHGRYSLLKGNIAPSVGKRLVEPDAALRDPHGVRDSLDHYTIDTDPATVRAQFFKKGKRVEGYDNASERVDYNIVASTEPSLRHQYATHAPCPQANAMSHRHSASMSMSQPQPQLRAHTQSHFAPAPPARFVETAAAPAPHLEQQ